MSRNSRVIEASPEQVWKVLSDGWLYPLWVVGASRMRNVEGTWPAVGSKLHHSVGTWPALLDDNTEVLELEPPSRLVLRARAWPSGEAQVTVQITAVGARTEVTMEEDVVRGPARLLPAVIRHPALAWRNVESLRRLAFVAEGRQ